MGWWDIGSFASIFDFKKLRSLIILCIENMIDSEKKMIFLN